ncbi:rhomboid family intramembrane serine protease [Flavobacterium sp. MC2016-06]|jgi:rhomboid protease GluP|uniref:rhomboid family intramembrane serine protease n=1 Tax=Flavobacterium sp. MC2016-06 TaxID=2676308 RepID=UPI0012BA9CF4|nr:rhomboid family intramembrane serine protease [Flavobacterium sp. MC2016-06]MBU3862114.1 rhomboid family intramembrane serine protease [Flavobacterium sp. MC2016-06]
MKDFVEKIKLIYFPFLVITLGFILIYTFFHWLIFIKLELFSIKEDMLKFWLPFALPCIPVYFFLRPRLKILKFKDDNKSTGFLFLAVLAIVVPTVIAQEYLITATGKITVLEDISEMQKFEKTKYYSLKDFYIDKKNIGVFNTSSISGKHNEYFNMEIYVAMPILQRAKDTSKFECEHWLGKQYSKQISNNLSNEEKKSHYKEFSKVVNEEFTHTNFRDFTYLELIGNTEDHDNFSYAIEENTNFDFKKPTLFEAHNEPFKNRNGEKMKYFFISLGVGLFIWFFILLFIKLKPYELKKFKNGEHTKNESLKETLEFFIPREGYYVTPILMNLNIAIYLIMVFAGFGFMSFKGKDLLEWGANFRPITTDGQWWRLLTSTFMHGGIMHLATNMFGLLFIGLFLEPVLGKKRYLLIYLATGIFASLASIWWYDATVSVGASGAIFGLYGLFIALLLTKVFPKEFSNAFLVSTLIFVGFNLLMGLTGGIDNAAHIGGLLSGFIIGIILSPRLKEEMEFDEE